MSDNASSSTPASGPQEGCRTLCGVSCWSSRSPFTVLVEQGAAWGECFLLIVRLGR